MSKLHYCIRVDVIGGVGRGVKKIGRYLLPWSNSDCPLRKEGFSGKLQLDQEIHKKVLKLLNYSNSSHCDNWHIKNSENPEKPFKNVVESK